MPSSNENVIKTIRNNYGNFNKSRKRIADIILNNGDIVAFMSLKELSDATKTSPVTVVSFAKEMGFESFVEMRKSVQKYIRSLTQPKYVVKPGTENFKDKNLEELLEENIKSEIGILQETYHCDNSGIINASKALNNAKKVYLVACGLVDSVAFTMKMRLSFLRIDAEILDLNNIPLLPAKLEKINPEDVFLIFSFPNYMSVITGVAKCARLKGCKIIGITDRVSSPLSSHCDILLLCQSTSLMFFNSLTAAISMVNTLATLVLAQREGQSYPDEGLRDLLLEYYPQASSPIEL